MVFYSYRYECDKHILKQFEHFLLLLIKLNVWKNDVPGMEFQWNGIGRFQQSVSNHTVSAFFSFFGRFF